MKTLKTIMLVVMVVLILCLCACGGKECSECGKRVSDGYEIFGRFMCEDCFF